MVREMEMEMAREMEMTKYLEMAREMKMDRELERGGDGDIRVRIFKLLRTPGIDSKESIPPAYVAWRAGTITLFILGSFTNSSSGEIEIE
jgi:hypothetical protein